MCCSALLLLGAVWEIVGELCCGLLLRSHLLLLGPPPHRLRLLLEPRLRLLQPPPLVLGLAREVLVPAGGEGGIALLGAA